MRMSKEKMMDALTKFGETPERKRLAKLAEDCRVKAGKNYQRKIRHFHIDKDGNLVWKKRISGEDPLSGLGHDYVIDADRLTESDWLAHMFSKMDYATFGEFVAAYMKALEMKGVKNLKVDIFGFDEILDFAE